jgi:hypothetical protein
MIKQSIIFIFTIILLGTFVFADEAVGSCMMKPPFSCIDFDVNSEGISVMIKSPEEAKIFDGGIYVNGENCEQKDYVDFTKSPFIITCSKKSNPGQTVKGEVVIVVYNEEGNLVEHKGSFEDLVESIEPIEIEPALPEDTVGCTFSNPNFACIDFNVDSEGVEVMIRKAEDVKMTDLAITVNGRSCEQVVAWDLTSNPMRLKCKLKAIEKKAEGKIQIMYWIDTGKTELVEGFFRGYVDIPIVTEEVEAVPEEKEVVLIEPPKEIKIPKSVKKSLPQGIKDIEPKVVIYKNVCQGCLYDNKCISFGIRMDERYCDADKDLVVQKENQAACSNDFECESNNCKDGSCRSSCDGCLKDNNCIPYGTRLQLQYCNLDGKLDNQMGEDSNCNNNYECSSNVCVNNQCISPSFIQKIIAWFSKLFGG